MAHKKIPDYIGGADFFGRFSDNALRQMAHPTQPEMPHAGDGIKNHFGMATAGAVGDAFDAVTVEDRLRFGRAVELLHPLDEVAQTCDRQVAFSWARWMPLGLRCRLDSRTEWRRQRTRRFGFKGVYRN